jgi:hypothetical protein
MREFHIGIIRLEDVGTVIFMVLRYGRRRFDRSGRRIAVLLCLSLSFKPSVYKNLLELIFQDPIFAIKTTPPQDFLW